MSSKLVFLPFKMVLESEGNVLRGRKDLRPPKQGEKGKCGWKNISLIANLASALPLKYMLSRFVCELKS